eukprot:TRINITY_DN5378_c0_g1_i1.p1 TRINITY_DN5378_c0_g1~~TRINITY_DN5378_c0_g1_i1.p1  ORF type:complete len:481 (+),score=83.53 TRINITY_DN5378_c0_g1_i1:121-1563(+)
MKTTTIGLLLLFCFVALVSSEELLPSGDLAHDIVEVPLFSSTAELLESIAVATNNDNHHDTYPKFQTVRELLEKKDFETKLKRLDFTNPEDIKEAERLRELELPFVLLNVPDIANAHERLTEDYILSNLPEESQTGWSDFISGRSALYQFDIGLTGMQNIETEEHKWLAREFPNFVYSPSRATENCTKNFFWFDCDLYPDLVARQSALKIAKAAQMRFHFDAGVRTYVAHIKGSPKRYILSPPNQCEFLDIETNCSHPRFRSTRVPHFHEVQLDQYPEFAQAKVLVAETAQGEVLYIPPFWFHLFDNLHATEPNYVLILRGGFSGVGAEEIGRCMNDSHLLNTFTGPHPFKRTANLEGCHIDEAVQLIICGVDTPSVTITPSSSGTISVSSSVSPSVSISASGSITESNSVSLSASASEELKTPHPTKTVKPTKSSAPHHSSAKATPTTDASGASFVSYSTVSFLFCSVCSALMVYLRLL